MIVEFKGAEASALREALNIDALQESGDLILGVRTAIMEVERLGYEMRDAVVSGRAAAVHDVTKRMERASRALAEAAKNFHEAVRRALAGPPS